MTRHSRNCTSGSVYTYHEKQRDARSSEYGTRELRVGRDSIRKFDCCCLTNQPCTDPVVTPLGFLYDREAILQCMLHQRKEIARRIKEFERQSQRDRRREEEETRRTKEGTVQKYMSANSVAKVQKSPAAEPEKLPSFWVPSMAPSAADDRLERPDEKVRCPMSKKPLRLKDLLSVRFTPAPGGSDGSGVRYVCAVTKDALTDSTALCVLRTSGSVVTKEAVDRLVRKEMRDPTNGRELNESDIIQLKKGASGFAASGHQLVSKETTAAMQVT